jgi:hypothetical protein
MLLEKGDGFVDGTPVDVVAVLAAVVIDFPGEEFPDDLGLRASGGRDRIGEGDHAAICRLMDLCDIVLNHQRVADGFDIDRHRTAVVGCGGACRDVCMRAALIFRVGKVKQPVRDIDLLDGRVDDRRDGGQ